MPQLVWDEVGKRVYETGLDRGVLYLTDGTAIPWNGLTAVTEKFEHERTPVYFDGMKINDLIVLGDFSATMKAITYPEEFMKLEGLGEIRHGMFIADQEPQAFHLSYRVKVGNDIESDEYGYKIHILYNLTALPNDKAYATQSVNPSIVEFEWDISAIPEVIPGYRPSAHLVLDSHEYDPWLLEAVELMLYGGDYAQANLPPMAELVEFVNNWYRWKVTDLGDGTYKLESGKWDMPDIISGDLESFQALGIQVTHHGDGTFTIYDTYDLADVTLIQIVDNGDGTWTAISQSDALIAVDENGRFQIFNANAVMVTPDEYQISNTQAN